jgi:formylglycine-generating enzyme required for sulfatase activity
MPVGAAKLESTLKTKGQLEVVTTLVGRYEAPGESWSDADLTGDCEGATHMIAALSVGAFTFSAGGAAEVGGGASVGPAGAGAKSAAAKELLQKDGETASCGGAKASDREPPQGCGGPFQIEVVPLRATRAATPPPPIAAPAEPAPTRPAATLAVQPPPTTPPTRPPTEASGMVSVPGGTFWMGSPDGEGDADEHPRHQATVAAFQMDRTEVTVAAYKACVDARGAACSTPDLHKGTYCNWGRADRSGHPINCVDWNQTTAYCAWAGKRLPTETEWEYAARGTDARKYPWGSAAPSNQLCWDGDGSALGKGNRQSTCAVGSYPAGRSPFGLEDMAGNVWEWTSSPMCPYPRKSCASSSRIIRGGSWSVDVPANVRGAHRNVTEPHLGSYLLGFRCARSNP